MKEGNTKEFTMNGGVGFIFSRLALEAPIIKDKASFIVAGRRSYIDVLAKPFLNDELSGSILNFYDLTLKARWNHLFSEKLFSNFTFYFSDYDYKINFGDDAVNKFTWNANIENYSIKPEFTYFINPQNILRFGGQSIVYTFEPGNAVGVSEGEVSDVSLDKKYAIESAVYLDMEQDISSALSVNYGVRLSHFNYTGEGNAYTLGSAAPGQRRFPTDIRKYDQWESIQTYLNLEPRFSLKWQFSPSASFKTSYNRTAQYLHLISNTTASTPVDVWTPSTNNIKPQIGDQVALGYFKNLEDNKYELSAEVYYKKMQNLVDYIDGADLLLNEFLEGDLLAGEGRAYGLEIQAKKNKGKLSGWLSYTLARTERLVEGINRNEWYPSRFDQLHNFSISAFYDLNERWSLSGTFVYNTGTPTTFATSRYEQQGYIVPHNANETRNNVRIPDYHRLDLSATLKGRPKKEGDRWIGDWVFSVYNAYNRRNPFSIYFQQPSDRVLADQPTPTQAVKLSVVGSFIPSISYNFKFQ